jgi:hypothetical protein
VVVGVRSLLAIATAPSSRGTGGIPGTTRIMYDGRPPPVPPLDRQPAARYALPAGGYPAGSQAERAH